MSYSRLKNVDDITTLNDVEIILEYFQPQNYYLSHQHQNQHQYQINNEGSIIKSNRSSLISPRTFNYLEPTYNTPQPFLLNQDSLPSLCNQYKWRFCVNLPVSHRPPYVDKSDNVNHANTKFYSCESRPLVVKIKCAYVDGQMGKVIAGTVYDHERRFFFHGTQHEREEKDLSSHKFKTLQNPKENIVVYDRLAHALAVYPGATAHIFEKMHRFFLLVEALDTYQYGKDNIYAPTRATSKLYPEISSTYEDPVPILVPDTPLFRDFLHILNKHQIPGFADMKRFVPYNHLKLYFASELYFAGEMVKLPEESAWYTNRVQKCSWALSMKRDIFQSTMQTIFNSNLYSNSNSNSNSNFISDAETLQIVVVNRKDAKCRQVKNHGALMKALRENTVLPSLISPITNGNIKINIIDFVGDQHDLEETMKLFATSHIVIAPHGAALSFTAAMPKGASVIEIAYPDADWPGEYFHTMILGSGLTYYLSMGSGHYCKKPIIANIQDVIGLVEVAAQNMLKYSLEQ